MEDAITVSSKSSRLASSSSVRGRVGRKYPRLGTLRGCVGCGLPVSVCGIFVVWETGRKMDNTDDELILVI